MSDELTPELTRICEKQYGDLIRVARKTGYTYEKIIEYTVSGSPDKDPVFSLLDILLEGQDKSIFVRYIKQLDEIAKRMAECDDRNRKNTLSTPFRNNNIDIDTGPSSAWTHYSNLLKKDGFENIDDILSSSKNILEMLKSETEPGHPVRGAVVGNVQSGKTANMEALMSLAADNGWNVFIILSGTIDSLRNQTEGRMIDDLTKLSDDDPLRYRWNTIKPLTSPKDFDRYIKMDLGKDSRERYLSVILKNVSHLKSLLKNFTRLNNIESMNLIVIDDEADLASVNTSKTTRTAINKLIINLIYGLDAEGKKLDRTFRSVNYICYTATPYAILLNESKGLYPEDFIFALTPSKRYFGLDRVFGSDDYPGMNIVKVSEDIAYSLEELDGHPENIPTSMKDCIAWFICCVAVLRQRNYGKPVSLLMNVDSKTKAHTIVDNTVVHYLTEERDDLLRRCKIMYEERNNFTIEDLKKSVPDYGRNSDNQPYPTIRDYPPYEAIEETVRELIYKNPSRILIDDDEEMVYSSGIHVCVDNCKDSAEDLDNNGNFTARIVYPRDDDPVMSITPAFIVIGGNTLSRGLTIKGLVATYFRRTNIKQADTLLQMGRWFGYRNGYELLPRIWMDSKAKKAFEVLSEINESLLKKIKEYSIEGISPGDYSVRIMNVPEANMLKSLTAKNKMQNATSSKLDFSGSDKEFHKYFKQSLNDNLELLQKFISWIPVDAEKLDRNRYLFRKVPKEGVLKFLDEFDRPKESYASSPNNSIKWMHKAEPGTLDDFNVVLSGIAEPDIVNMAEPSIGFKNDKYIINKILRTPSDKTTDSIIHIKTVRDKEDMIADIPQEIIDTLSSEDKRMLKKGDITTRSHVKELAGLGYTPLLALYVAKCVGCEEDVVMASWYIPKATRSTEVFDTHEYVYLEEDL